MRVSDLYKILWYLLCGSLLLVLGSFLIQNDPNMIKLDNAGIVLIILSVIDYMIPILIVLFRYRDSRNEASDYIKTLKGKLSLCQLLKTSGECKYSIYQLKKGGYSDILNQYNYTEEHGYKDSDMVDCIYSDVFLESLDVTRNLVLKSELEDVEAMLNKQLYEAEHRQKKSMHK